MKINIGVMGASGYAGMQLVHKLLVHEYADLCLLTAERGAGQHLKEINPIFEVLGDKGLMQAHNHIEDHLDLDVIFLALPHGISQEWVKRIRHKCLLDGKQCPILIDLSGDYRLPAKDYEAWYGQPHMDSEGLNNMHYGLPALFKMPKGTKGISNPGCYATAAILALAPLLVKGLIDPETIVVDAKSGVSGAGRSLSLGNLYCEVNESVKPYGVSNHRHTPEIEYHLERLSGSPCRVQFTPHLVPMQYGILASVYTQIKGDNPLLTLDNATEALRDLFTTFYAESPIVKVLEGLPETRWVVGTPYAHMAVRLDRRTRRAMVFCAIDNTLLGAATQAIQNMNIALKLPELTGLV